MRTLIGTSGKMNLTSSEASRYCRALRPLVDDVVDCDLFVLPPFTAIWAVAQGLRGSRVAWGAQDVHPEDSGAHTGDVSAPMLADLGCTYVEVGHSERRRDYGASDERVAAQVSAIQRWGMTAIVCVGEPEREPLAGVMTRVRRQLELLASADASRLVLAYEPVWAIGVGSNAEPGWVGEVHGAIHTWLRENVGRGAEVPVDGRRQRERGHCRGHPGPTRGERPVRRAERARPGRIRPDSPRGKHCQSHAHGGGFRGRLTAAKRPGRHRRPDSAFARHDVLGPAPPLLPAGAPRLFRPAPIAHRARAEVQPDRAVPDLRDRGQWNVERGAAQATRDGEKSPLGSAPFPRPVR